MVTTAHPRLAPRSQPQRPASEEARLRVVADSELAEARRRLRARRLFACGVAVVALGLFGVVIAHVLLMQGQFELQALQQRSSEAQAEYDRLRLQVSELESPDRIVAVAQQKLGMVAPPKITYLAPSSDPAALPVVAASTTETSASAPAGPPASWSTVKPHLAEG